MSDDKEWKPWNESKVWRNKTEFYSWLRGGIRKAIWTRYPPRNEYKSSRMRNVTEGERIEYGFSKLLKKVGNCEQCGELFKGKDLEVHHKVGAGSLRDEEDISKFIMNIACMKSDMMLVCQECHKTITHAERYGMTFDQAFIERRIIKILNQNSSEDLKKMLDAHKLPSNNDLVRRDSVRKLIERGLI